MNPEESLTLHATRGSLMIILNVLVSVEAGAGVLDEIYEGRSVLRKVLCLDEEISVVMSRGAASVLLQSVANSKSTSPFWDDTYSAKQSLIKALNLTRVVKQDGSFAYQYAGVPAGGEPTSNEA